MSNSLDPVLSSLTRGGPGFLERGFICIMCGVFFAAFISFFLNIP